MLNNKRRFTFAIMLNGWSLFLWLRAFDAHQGIDGLSGFELRKDHQPWRWVKVYKGDYGVRYSEGMRGREVVGWRLRGPFEFTHSDA